MPNFKILALTVPDRVLTHHRLTDCTHALTALHGQTQTNMPPQLLRSWRHKNFIQSDLPSKVQASGRYELLLVGWKLVYSCVLSVVWELSPPHSPLPYLYPVRYTDNTNQVGKHGSLVVKHWPLKMRSRV